MEEIKASLSQSTFTAEEILKIQLLRSACSDILTSDQIDDHYLVRWLRARQLDVPKAEEMLRKSMKWRKDMKVDGILDREEIPLKYRRMYPTAMLGRDCDDNIVLLCPLGRFNHRVLIEQEGLEAALKYNTMWMERLMRMVKETEKETGKKGLRLVELMDMECYSYKELAYGPGREFFVKANKALDENYPEMLKTMLVINAPKIFALAYNFVKPVLSKETQSKIHIFGTDEDAWKNELRTRFDPERIPERWGGTRKGSDEFCSQDPEVWLDAPIPLSYFTNDDRTEGFKSEKVKARDKFILEIPVSINDDPGSQRLHWKFKVDSHDISFSINFTSSSNCSNSSSKEGSSKRSSAATLSSTIIIPEFRVDSKQGVKEGSVECKSSGVYTLMFDNSYSYTRSKTVHYAAHIIQVDGDIDIHKSDEDTEGN